MHDIQRKLPVIDARTVHSKFHLLRTGQLSRQHPCLTENHHSALSKTERDSLCVTCSRGLLPFLSATSRRYVDCGIGQFHERDAAFGPLQRLTGKRDDARDLFSRVASPSDSVIAKQLV